MLTLRVQGVGGDHGVCQVERGQQTGEAGDLVGLVRDPQLADGVSGPGDRGQQVSGRDVHGA
ncbi:hypothetical protein OTB19_36460 [Streptomyces sp. H27-H5]|nr:hypothetical protein [Streptomyces sp. H27-H5]MCY0962333.1 hypothetical protein [Streptomyces sp. H27-H5]